MDTIRELKLADARELIKKINKMLHGISDRLAKKVNTLE